MFYKQFFDDKLAQYSYLIGCQATGEAIVIDPMRDVDQYINTATREGLTITKAVDTHIHADYISGLREFAERGAKVYGSDEGDADWKYEWLIGSDYDYELLKNNDEIKIGNITIKAWHTPGHTPEHLSYFITDGAAADVPMGVATGDFVFVGDVGRPDLLESAAGMLDVMEPSARTLYKTVEEFKSLPEYIQIWPGHGAGSACGKALGAIPETTVGYELRFNNSLKSATSEDNFVKFILEGQPEPPMYFARMKRDNKIGPKLLKGLPNPKRLTVAEINQLAGKGKEVAIIDTRERDQYAAGHLPGSLLSPLNKQFNTVVGSYVDEDEKMYLVADEHQVKEAVVDLIRIGLDNIEGYITPADLRVYHKLGGKLDTLDMASFEKMEALAQQDGYVILDVRKGSEFSEKAFDGAVNFAHTRLFNRKDEIAKDKTYLVHCMTGGRSAVASAYLKREGHNVVLVEDDFTAYMNSKVTA
ncbi:MAG: MBL fold metallo-hydrolase [Candidatus Cyclonatronum sp.]|uniref:MBL fold metallo-hydrolase n=1 Tax=Cyclonatronum sp. TaxID=3024185 RepID=UPI0025BE3A23|nr:MBL fold metallo-hydrolase [Cyclonatronum sp.]MCH8488019.1 MBL fold metallo-hydrolase [Cyclonatronum sp.]